MEQSEAVQVLNVSKSFSQGKEKSEQVLHNISFHVKKGEIVTLLGQSGCGKSTLLNIIGRFEREDSGTVLFGGKTADRPNKSCIMMFQNYGLLPWRSVLGNVELGLEERGLNAKKRRTRALDYLRLVGLEDKADSFPRQLSGGMQQRVALARALAIEPELILMDEPFAALDTFTRYHLQNELLRIQKQSKTTIILVTHDIDEAVYLSDRILILSSNPGTIHKEIGVNTTKPRDRGHGDFQHFRKQILEQFHFNGSVSAAEFSI
ncbi:MAG: putative transporter ATP-binding protein [Paenibacillus sp.]|nr:putative transporter ATP-binding protein [Paenibacillus sp.]